MVNVFGFNREKNTGGDFLPIVKYNAKAGMILRVDRQYDGTTATSEEVDITDSFKAMFDFEHVESGWMAFPPNSAPSFVMVPRNAPFPSKPSDIHKNGVRFCIKLAKDCAGSGPPVREISSSAGAFLDGAEAVFIQYDAEKAQHPGELPVLMLDRKLPVKTAFAGKSTTNFQPVWKIVGWAPRGDFQFVPKAAWPAGDSTIRYPLNGGPAPSTAQPKAHPDTGGTRAAPPPPRDTVSADDFG
jgi:hypothetical protein